jgi:chemotaxis protein methyltransferase CheR
VSPVRRLRPGGRRSRPVEADPATLDQRLVEAAAELLTERAGCRLDQLVLDRLPEVAAEAALVRQQDAGEFLATLATDASAFQALLDHITVQETWFFREPAHFKVLIDQIMPGLPDKGVIWSAGCANGQEPWSLVMALEEAGRSGWQVLGTDLSTRALARAERASYGQRELRGLSAARQARFTVPHGNVVSVAPRLRERARFARHNLATDPAPLPAGICPVIFCRNTLIYLRPERRQAALTMIAEALRPGGWLFLGFSESLWQLTDAFEAVRLDGAYAYRRRGAGDPAGPAGRSRPARRSRRDGRTARARPEATGAGGPAPPPADDPVTAARQVVYERPDDPLAHLDLGLRLEASGDPAAARRSYAAARGALGRVDPAAVEAALEGWRADQLAALLATKLGGVAEDTSDGDERGGPRWNR